MFRFAWPVIPLICLESCATHAPPAPLPFDEHKPRGHCDYIVTPPTQEDPNYYVVLNRNGQDAYGARIRLTVTGWRNSGSLDGKSTPMSEKIILIAGPLVDRLRINVAFAIGSVAHDPESCEAFEPLGS
jgi:hypothetical protein